MACAKYEPKCTGNIPANATGNNTLAPSVDTEYSYNSDASLPCTYRCNPGYKYEGGKCREITCCPYGFKKIDGKCVLRDEFNKFCAYRYWPESDSLDWRDPRSYIIANPHPRKRTVRKGSLTEDNQQFVNSMGGSESCFDNYKMGEAGGNYGVMRPNKLTQTTSSCVRYVKNGIAGYACDDLRIYNYDTSSFIDIYGGNSNYTYSRTTGDTNVLYTRKESQDVNTFDFIMGIPDGNGAIVATYYYNFGYKIERLYGPLSLYYDNGNKLPLS